MNASFYFFGTFRFADYTWRYLSSHRSKKFPCLFSYDIKYNLKYNNVKLKNKKIMDLYIIQIGIGAILLLELILCIRNSKTEPDFTWFLCRPFGILLPMRIGAIIRLVCAVLGSILLYRGIIGVLYFLI